MDVRMLGPLEVAEGDRLVDLGGARQRRLCLALLVDAGDVVANDLLAERLWDDSERPAHPLPQLRTAISRLRLAIPQGDARIVTRPTGYRFEATGVSIDAQHFEALRRKLAHKRTGDAEGALRLADDALALWRGRALDDVADLPWAVAAAQRFEELRRLTEDDRFDLLLASGRAAEAVADLEAAVAAEPLREQRHGQLMVAYYRCGRHVDALRAYEQYRSRLATDVGLEPGDALRQLEARILAGDPSLHLRDHGATARSANLQPEERSLRSYRLGRQLGEGAFSLVWQASQPTIGREVAIKQIRAELANRPEFVRRFEAEAHLVARLEHPHIVPLYDYWREPGSAYLVMRWLRGGTLQERIDRDGPLPLADCLRLAAEIGGALEAAHRASVVHRDVKPGNVFLDGDGHFYLGDFGIALDVAETVDPEASLSAGSPAYAAPEQLRREPVGTAADVHALGVTLYEALTGRIPFPDEPNQAALLERQLHDPLPPPTVARPELPAALDEVIATATAKLPSARYPSVVAFVAAFANACAPAPASGEAGGVSRPRRDAATALGFGAANPYKGLRPFTEADSGDFFGRDRLVAELVDHLAQPGPAGRMLTVVGPSGSGKSSVVRAGLLPALRRGAVAGADRWLVVDMVPSAHPFEELEAALLRVAVDPPERLGDVLMDGPRGVARVLKSLLAGASTGPGTGTARDTELVLVIDQFEELFTLCDDQEQRRRFLVGLAEAVRDPRSGLRLVLTLRADFFDRPLRYPEFAPLVKASAVTVTPLGPDELERAISEPAARAGCELEPGLVARVVADVADQPGALPLLQYALTELYDRQVSGLLTRRAYDELGGLTGSLAKRADELAGSLDETGEAAIRRLFGRLVTLGEGVEDTRRRVRRSELVGVPDELLTRFGDARLLSFDRDPLTREPTVEVAHEALIRQWPRLRTWLDSDRDGLRLHRHLTASAAAWDAAGRDPGELYRGGRLEAAEAWAAHGAGDLNASESAFLGASLDQRTAERAAAERSQRRMRRALAAVAAVAAVALVAGGLAFHQRGAARQSARAADAAAAEANRQSELASASAAEAETRRLVADAASIVSENRDVALLLASEAYRRDPGPQTLAGLQRVLTSTGPYLGTIGAGHDFVAGGYLGDGRVAGLSRPAGSPTSGLTSVVARFYDPATWAETAAVPLSQQIDLTEYFPPPVHLGASHLVVGTATGTVVLMDGRTTREVRVSSAAIRSVDVRDGLMAVGDFDGIVRLVDVATGETRWATNVLPEKSFRDAMGEQAWAALNPAVSSLLDEGSAGVFRRGPTALLLTPSGSLLAVAGPFVRRLDLATGAIVDQFLMISGGEGNTYARPIRSAVERPDGRLRAMGFGFVVTLSPELEVESRAFPPIGRADGNVVPTSMVLDRDGTPWFGMSNGQIAKGTTTAPLDAALRYQTTAARVASLALSPDGGHLLVAGRSGLGTWAVDGRQVLARAVPRSGHVEGSISADGNLLITSSLNGGIPAVFYDLSADPPRRRDTSGLPTTATYAAMDDPTSNFVTALQNGRYDIYDRHTLAKVGEVPDAGFIAVSNDGRLFAGASASGRYVRVYDTATWQQVSPTIDTIRYASVNAVPSFDAVGKRLFISVRNGTTAAYDTTTWEQVGEISPSDHGGALGVRFSADGSLMVTRGVDTTIAIRNPDTFEVIRTIEGGTTTSDPQSTVVTMSTDNQYAITRDGSPRLWHLPSATVIGTFPRDDGTTPWPNDFGDQLRLVTIQGDYALSWNLDVTTWPQIACKAAGRNLTRAEWDQFGPKGAVYQQTCPQWPNLG